MLSATSYARTTRARRNDHRNQPGRTESRRSNPFLHKPVARREDIVRTDSTGIVETAAQILQMNLLSLKGYQELADVAPDESIQTFAEIMVRQRSAQCRELAKILADHPVPQELENNACEELRLAWVRALWALDQGEIFNGMEGIEQAEEMLEDAYLNAAALYGRCPIAVVFCRHAMNVCGARQRLDDPTSEALAEDADIVTARAN
ncbi:MAG: hypothetical protein IT428_18600 [Planctomycetaceae bacterium]|nr:hypothetical protein [Planctomycetaceae bacterium]